MVEIVGLLVAPEHAYEGRPQDGPRPDAQPVARTEVTVRAGLGLATATSAGRRTATPP
ncbi:hypothetical protein [Jiangella alkaliphila]|uniref:hypothetical protein n=1 Tax=Jiangella alkaliphila TaxID=419479 RepID=UPI0018D41AAF|nr:hypothetical protein [Jiangella alkaliphila]